MTIDSHCEFIDSPMHICNLMHKLVNTVLINAEKSEN
jgi:hypothetical protein